MEPYNYTYVNGLLTQVFGWRHTASGRVWGALQYPPNDALQRFEQLLPLAKKHFTSGVIRSEQNHEKGHRAFVMHQNYYASLTLSECGCQARHVQRCPLCGTLYTSATAALGIRDSRNEPTQWGVPQLWRFRKEMTQEEVETARALNGLFSGGPIIKNRDQALFSVERVGEEIRLTEHRALGWAQYWVYEPTEKGVGKIEEDTGLSVWAREVDAPSAVRKFMYNMLGQLG